MFLSRPFVVGAFLYSVFYSNNFLAVGWQLTRFLRCESVARDKWIIYFLSAYEKWHFLESCLHHRWQPAFYSRVLFVASNWPASVITYSLSISPLSLCLVLCCVETGPRHEPSIKSYENLMNINQWRRNVWTESFYFLRPTNVSTHIPKLDFWYFSSFGLKNNSSINSERY